jgi:hypothetical protein
VDAGRRIRILQRKVGTVALASEGSMAFKSDRREREFRSFDAAHDNGTPDEQVEFGYGAARAQQLALRDGEPGYGYGEDYKRDRRRHADSTVGDQPSADAII